MSMEEYNFTQARQNWGQQQIRGDHGGIPINGAGSDFQLKERKRRTMQEQIGFNIERISVLHKEFQELKQMLNDYIIQVPQRETETSIGVGTGEANSEMMYSLLRETTMINELIQYVSELKRDLQL